MKRTLIALGLVLAMTATTFAQGNGKKMGHRKGRQAYAWQADPDGRYWRLDRKGNKIWRDDKKVKRNLNRGGNWNNGDNGDRNNYRGRGDRNNR